MQKFYQDFYATEFQAPPTFCLLADPHTVQLLASSTLFA